MYTLDELNTLIAESEQAKQQALANANFHAGMTEAWQRTKAKMQETQAGAPKTPAAPAKEGKD